MVRAAFAASAPLCAPRAGSALCARTARPLSVTSRPVRAARVAPVRMLSAESVRIAIAVYGVFVAGGGVGAFVKSGSKMSALSGVSAGALLAAAYAKNSVPLALGVAATLIVVFAARLFATKKFMPAGMLALLSTVFAALFAYSVFA